MVRRAREELWAVSGLENALESGDSGGVSQSVGQKIFQ